MNKEKIISIAVVVLVIGAIATFAFLGAGKNNNANARVATVNGVDISKADYDKQLASVISSYQGQGVDVSNVEIKGQIEDQVLNDLINNELVNQGIKKAGIKATDEQVEEQYQLLVTQAGDEDKLNEQLVAANITEEQLRANIAKQLEIQAYLKQNIDVESATSTDAEIQDYYDTNVKGQENAPELADVKDQIAQLIVANKQQQLVNTFIDTLRGQATIQTYLNK